MRAYPVNDVRPGLTPIVRDIADAQMRASGLRRLDFDIVVAIQSGGYAYHDLQGRYRCKDKLVVVPFWALTRSKKPEFKGLLDYYVAHELAHLYVGPGLAHSSKFMTTFKKLCPPEFQHWETQYNPDESEAAGIPTFQQWSAMNTSSSSVEVAA